MRTASPYERYLDTLRSAGLAETALALDWTRAGEQALAQAVATALPFRESGYFPSETPTAAAYRLDLRRGRQLVIDVTLESLEPGRLFVDLFELREADPPRRVASLEPQVTTLSYDVDRDGHYVLRLQPELLRGGRYTLVERTLSSLAFPIPTLTAKAVQSFFGAARDAGVREHEGVDIFAPRGTAVVAVADGVARPSTNGLGGNVVWLSDSRQRRTFYFAHLDRWAFEGTSSVRRGDVVGYVGNTGNARTTSPHLHFGIYENGAIDPLPFIQPDDPIPPPLTIVSSQLGLLVRIVPARTPLRDAVARDGAVRRQMERGTIGRVLGESSRAVRLLLPDGAVGYVDSAATASTAKPLRVARLPAGTVLRERPLEAAPVVDVLTDAVQAEVIGSYSDFDLVRLAGERTAWLARP